jgi:hypothetical protein
LLLLQKKEVALCPNEEWFECFKPKKKQTGNLRHAGRHSKFAAHFLLFRHISFIPRVKLFFAEIHIAERHNVENQIEDITNCVKLTKLRAVIYHLAPPGSCQEK